MSALWSYGHDHRLRPSSGARSIRSQIVIAARLSSRGPRSAFTEQIQCLPRRSLAETFLTLHFFRLHLTRLLVSQTVARMLQIELAFRSFAQTLRHQIADRSLCDCRSAIDKIKRDRKSVV